MSLSHDKHRLLMPNILINKLLEFNTFKYEQIFVNKVHKIEKYSNNS